MSRSLCWVVAAVSGLAVPLTAAVAAGGAVVTTRFNVLSPQTLNKPAMGYKHRNALFGNPPYGQSIEQVLRYAPSKMCKEEDAAALTNENTETTPFVLLVDRGGCSFVEKVRNAQKAGASAVLIADDLCICGSESCPKQTGGTDPITGERILCQMHEPIMSDDGTGSDITIPSFLLSKQDSKPIREALLSEKEEVQVQMSFDVPPPAADQATTVQVDLWTTPVAHALATDNAEPHGQLLEDIYILSLAFQDTVSLTPHMFLDDGLYAGCLPDETGASPCGDVCSNHGRYCFFQAEDPEHGLSGAQVVTESLRRICLWDLVQDQKQNRWWSYVLAFEEVCNVANNHQSTTDECSAKAMTLAGLESQEQSHVDQCMARSGGTAGDQFNVLLNRELSDQASAMVNLAPTLVVNNAIVRGSLNFETAFQSICAGFATVAEEPAICQACAQCSGRIKACVQHGGVCPLASTTETTS